MAQQAQPIDETYKGMAPQTSAWLMLLGFFALFCALTASAVFLSWRYYTTATLPVDGALIRSHVNVGVVIQARDRQTAESIERLPPERDPCIGESDICATLSEGESVRTRREAGYGPVASLVLPDQTQIDLWAWPSGADLTLERFQVSQFTNQRQEVVLSQRSGYARYDIADGQPYDEVDYTVQIDGETRVRLAPGGSYSIDVPIDEPGRLPRLTAAGLPILAEVAVRSGSATIERGDQRTIVSPGNMAHVDTGGSVGAPVAAQWELIQDGDFSQFKQQNQYLPGSLTWLQLTHPDAPGMEEREKNGRLTVVRACRPETPDLCVPDDQVTIAQLRRDGGQTRPFTVGIEQHLDVDVSEYTSLRLRAWVRVLQQSVPGSGVQGSECPVMIQIVYKPTSPTDAQQDRFFCIYTTEGGEVDVPDVGVIRYRPVPPYTWYRLDVELRDDSLIKQARYIQLIRVEARGHDYFSELTDISLVGRQ